MKKSLQLLPLIILALFTILFSCKKETKPDPENDLEKIEHSDDQALLSGEMDAVTNDLNLILEGNSSFSGRGQDEPPCSSTLVYDTAGGVRKVTIVYDGEDCSGYRSRSGSVEISMPSSVRWRDAGAEITVTYQSLDITRLIDGKSITINGSHKLKNVEGGLLFNLLTGRPYIKHAVTSNNLTITFDDNTQAQWQVARQRVYTLANGGTVTITGTHQSGGQTNISEWGTDRFGKSFTSSISSPLVISGNCQFRLVSGAVTHVWNGSTAAVTFGLNAQGNAVSCPSGNFYYKLVWTGAAGASLTFIAPY